MSKDTLSGGCQQRYKGIEGFLRRVAFNLGNSPSETEVKIISCIPIDVTDLQQKIADLEKQLEETGIVSNASSPDKLPCGNKSLPAKKSPPTDKSPSSPCPSGTLSSGSNKKASPTNKAATNKKKAKKAPSKRNSFVANQVMCANADSYDMCEDTAAAKHSSVSIRFDCSPGQTKKSVISFLYPTSPGKNCNIVAQVSNVSIDKNEQEKLKEPKKSFFHKKKSRTTKKKNGKAELVYYAAPVTKTPFNNLVLGDDATSKNAHREGHDDYNDDELYLSHILNKQYMPRPALNDLSNTSEFSSPICRDNVTYRTTNPYESDVCSCCRGPFQNLDLHMSPAHRLDLCPTFTEKENDNKFAYYDSSAYDIIPVKEKNYKSAENFDVFNRREFRRHIDMKCWPESVRAKKVQPLIPKFVPKGRRNQRVLVNYHTVVGPIRNNLNIKSIKKNTKKDIVLNSMAEKRPIQTHSLNLKPQNSNICDVEFGEVYAKQNRTQKLFSKPLTLRNASCSTTILNNSECQTGMETTESLVEDKTAVTLNQIKAILQSVLTEVKTKGKLASQSEPKKDAVVQNGLSQCNIIGGSHLLNSYTYSHYNTNPYNASCSRQMPPNCCLPNVPYSGPKCIQQYPLFVQPNRQLCSTCDKNYVAKQLPAMQSVRPAVTAATNTDQTRDRNKETQKLIKEIYNSIALNIEIPTKDSALNQGDQNKRSNSFLMKTDTENEINKTSNLLAEIFKNPNPLNTSVTEKLTPVSKLTSNDTTFRSGYNNNKVPLTNKHTVDNNHSANSTSITADTEPERVEVYRAADTDDQSDDTAVNEGDATDSSSTDDDTEKHVPATAEQATKKQGRKGILSKMFKLFTPRNKRQPKKSIKEQNDNESDSDDYQTVYSQKVSARPKREVRKVQEVRKVHHPLPTKVIHSKHHRMKQRSPERFKRAPYMEQEYRRYWDEKLLFQERYGKHSTEASRMTTPQVMPRPVYYQNYEARSALVEPNRRMVASAMHNIHRNPTRRSSYVTNRMPGNRPRVTSKGLAWLKKHKLGIQCGEQWKKLILEG